MYLQSSYVRRIRREQSLRFRPGLLGDQSLKGVPKRLSAVSSVVDEKFYGKYEWDDLAFGSFSVI